MVGHVITTGAVLLLLGALPTGALADNAAWSRCEGAALRGARVLGSGPDYQATDLNLRACNIRTLHLDSFNDLPNVTHIDLNTNNIEHLNTAAFMSVPNLTRLLLNHNALREVPNFGENSVLPHLTYLSITFNDIESLSNLNTFSSCGQLKSIVLNSNRIDYIHPDFFVPLKSLEALFLGNNTIRMIASGTFAIKTLNHINLSKNLIEYVHPLAFRGSKLEQLYLVDNRLAHLPANFLSELNRAGASLKRFFFYGNPWQCACLLEQLADVKRAGVPWMEYSWYHYTGCQPECVFTGRYPCLRRVPSALLTPPPSS